LVIIPHWGQEEFQTNLEKIKNYYRILIAKLLLFRDDEAVVINGAEWKVIPSR
jgi:hypothetical protein